MAKKKTMKWTAWHPFPNPEEGGYLSAPFGPGVYELRNHRAGKRVLVGASKNVAYRMTSLLPSPLGAGNRNNRDKPEYVQRHLSDIEYRTRACIDEIEARKKERNMRKKHCYIFRT